MLYKRLFLNVSLRVFGILINSLLLAYVWFQFFDWLIALNLLFFLLLQCVMLIRSLNRLNQDLENFFISVRNKDTSVIFNQMNKNSSLRKVYKQFDFINEDMQNLRFEIENRNQYFKTLVEHVGVGLIAFDEKGKVSLFNPAANELFNLNQLFRIQDLDRIQTGLCDELLSLKPGEQKLISLYRNKDVVHLSVKISDLKLGDKRVRLVSFQNIKNELDEKELDSWQKLIRVLTHEIMNSVSPINSSIGTMMDLFADEATGKAIKADQINTEILDDVLTALSIIDERNTGMIDFVTRFRDLTLLPEPNFQTMNIEKLVRDVIALLSHDIDEGNITCQLDVRETNLDIRADKGMLEQVLINLLRNAIQALNEVEFKRLDIIIGLNGKGRPYIEVVDNGCGISEEIKSEIFVPFFTTKEQGTGIGLSLSRQLMRLHGGTLNLQTEVGQTSFIMRF